MTMQDNVYDVAIIGCGPVGAVMANLLGGYGLRVAVFEIGSSVYHLPRAAHFDAEIMRVFQAIGLAEAVLPATKPIKGMDFLNGDGKKLFGFAAGDGDTWQGWPQGFLFYQPDLETALRAGLSRFPSIDVYYEHEVLAFKQHGDGVEVTVRDLRSGANRVVHASYVVGADGGRSITRKLAGLELEDLGFDQPWLVVDTMLKRDVELPDVALQICNPARPATFIPSSGRHRRWEFMLLPGESAELMEQREHVEELMRPWVMTNDTEITRAVVYTFHALIAKQWRDRHVLIIGDAAHQMPPFLGQGMCSGIRDAHNIAWKLRLVLTGAADEALLDTYQRERAPHVRTIIERAVGFGRIIQTTDPAVAEARDAGFLAQAGNGPPPAFSDTAMPSLGVGAVAASPPAGALFPQPFVHSPDGSRWRLDDLLGDGFAVIGAAAQSGALARAAVTLSTATDASCRAIAIGDSPSDEVGVTTVFESGTIMRDWLATHGATIVRPDHYVFGAAKTAAGLEELTTELTSQLARTRVRP
jgi:3-(3-hydroxy-phenyl)propionate hydroxylase